MASGGAASKGEPYYVKLRKDVLEAMEKAKTKENIEEIVTLLDGFDERNATSKEILDVDLGKGMLLPLACSECSFTPIVPSRM